ncbi:MAG: GNAT family N-acetyltransferase [Cytophagaceae bacterium]|nr:GNAT family N-acetyltransferase [Cytophagaceae bacterium]
MQSKESFKKFCEQQKDIPVFLTYGWLNTVAKNWDVCIEERGGEIIGFLPYVIKKKSGFTLIELPSLTPYGGIWIKYFEGQKYASELSFEKEVYSSLIEKLPPFDFFALKFYPGFSNWLPFYWKGFKQTTAYTYIIEDLRNYEQIFNEFKENIRREIRKAEKELTVYSSDDISILYHLKKENALINHSPLTASEEYLKSIYNFCKENNTGNLLIAKDQNGNIHAAAFFVTDHSCCYYLYGAAAPAYKNSGAMSLLMWEAIKKASQKVNKFNFEGSMVEEIERFFRSFGARQVPYFVIQKTNSRILKLRDFIKEIF